MAKKDFAAMDKRNDDNAAIAALSRRFDDSRVSVFEAPLADLARNPENPRDADDPQVIETRDSLLAVGQLQEIRIVTREVFLDAYPMHEATLEPGKWVVIMGNRRLEAAKLADMASLRAQLSPDVESCQDIEDRIIHENVHRLDLPPLREADLYKRKMERDGVSARELAASVSKSHAYINQRLALLRLIPELQALIRDGELGLKDSRSLSALTAEQQREIWRAGPPYRVQQAIAGNPVSSKTDTSGDRQEPGSSTTVVDRLSLDSSESDSVQASAAMQETDRGATAPPRKSPSRESNGHSRRSSLTIRGSSPAELADALRKELDAAAIAELVDLLRSDA